MKFKRNLNLINDYLQFIINYHRYSQVIALYSIDTNQTAMSGEIFTGIRYQTLGFGVLTGSPRHLLDFNSCQSVNY